MCSAKPSADVNQLSHHQQKQQLVSAALRHAIRAHKRVMLSDQAQVLVTLVPQSVSARRACISALALDACALQANDVCDCFTRPQHVIGELVRRPPARTHHPAAHSVKFLLLTLPTIRSTRVQSRADGSTPTCANASLIHLAPPAKSAATASVPHQSASTSANPGHFQQSRTAQAFPALAAHPGPPEHARKVRDSLSAKLEGETAAQVTRQTCICKRHLWRKRITKNAI